MIEYIVKHSWLYYLIQFTWGILMNIVGGLTFLVLMVCGFKPKKFHNCFYIEVGEYWGGLELGTFFLCQKDSSESLKLHEAGHGIQNLFWGPLFPLVIGIPSAIRYWYREIVYIVNEEKYYKLPPYDFIWFEGQASLWGERYYKEEKK